jgi:hypothetical protein
LIHLLVRSSITESELIAMPLEAVISTSGLFNVLVSHGQPLARASAVIFAASRPLLEMGASNSHVARTHANCSRTSPASRIAVSVSKTAL